MQQFVSDNACYAFKRQGGSRRADFDAGHRFVLLHHPRQHASEAGGLFQGDRVPPWWKGACLVQHLVILRGKRSIMIPQGT